MSNKGYTKTERVELALGFGIRCDSCYLLFLKLDIIRDLDPYCFKCWERLTLRAIKWHTERLQNLIDPESSKRYINAYRLELAIERKNHKR